MAACALAALVLFEAFRVDGEGTAGDDESNIFLDGVDDVKSALGAWPTGSEPYKGQIVAAAERYQVPPLILAWLLWKESRYSFAIVTGAKRSPAGAMGIAQFMPATAAQELGSVAAALDPGAAIPGAARYLAKLRRSVGTWAEALAAYNWGIGNVKRKGIGAAPEETKDYFATILAKAGGNYA